MVELNEDTSRHIAQVLRMKAGSELELSNGAGQMLQGSLVSNDKKKCIVAVKNQWLVQKSNRHIAIGISLLKNAPRFEWFVEKAAELGVTEIIPLQCERTEKQHFRFERMRNILVAAMLQSQQAWLPKLYQPTLLSKVMSNTTSTTKLIAHCLNNEKRSINEFKTSKDSTILIGPEGDFGPTEIEAALKQSFTAVTLGHTRLRTETAGLVAATCLCIQ